jgi:hypothetical protein
MIASSGEDLRLDPSPFDLDGEIFGDRGAAHCSQNLACSRFS